MDGFIVLLIDKYGWAALIGGVFLYLIVEGGLDIATDIISHKIVKKMDKEPE